jgi:hypothetical protein
MEMKYLRKIPLPPRGDELRLWSWMMKRLRLPLAYVLYLELAGLCHSLQKMKLKARMVVTLELKKRKVQLMICVAMDLMLGLKTTASVFNFSNDIYKLISAILDVPL